MKMQIGKFKIIESNKTHFSTDFYDVKDGRKKVAEISIGCRDDIAGLFFGKKSGKYYEKQRYFKNFEHCLENLESSLGECKV